MTGFVREAKASIAVRSRAATEAYADLMPLVSELRTGGASFAAIAERLNGEGYTTSRGKPFTPMTVHRIIGRAGD